MDDDLVKAIARSVIDAGDKFISLTSTTIHNMDADYWLKLGGVSTAFIAIMYIKKKFL